MGWSGDDIMPRAGVYELFNANNETLGIVATWYEPVPGMKYFNEWRVHAMPLPSAVQSERTADYHVGQITGDTIQDRRIVFQQVWNAYKAAKPEIMNFPTYDPNDPNTEPGLVDRQLVGTVQDGTGFNIQGAGSATTYGGPPGANRNP